MKSFGRRTAIQAARVLVLLIPAFAPAADAAANAPAAYVLTVESANPATGITIAVSPKDQNEKANGIAPLTRDYRSGETVTLTAPSIVDGKYAFASWTGCASATSEICKVAMNANKTVRANYVAGKIYVLIVDSANPASGVPIQVSPPAVKGASNGVTGFERTYIAGTTVTLKAPAKAGSNGFSSWSGCKTAVTTTCKVTVNKPTTVVAKYAAPVNYTLTVASTNPSGGINVQANVADIHNTNHGTTTFHLTYRAGTKVQLTAISPSAGYSFLSWSGCASSTKAGVCNVQVAGNMTVTANYSEPDVTGVKITPSPATAIIGTSLELTATVEGTGSISHSVTWSLAAEAGSHLSPGTLTQTSSTTASYITPYPAPATVQIAAISTEAPGIRTTATVSLKSPAAASGPALSVDVNTPNTPSENPHKISPLIYGMNGYLLDSASAAIAHPGVVRWGGDDTSRYNYKNDMTNSAADYYFESFEGAASMPGGGNFTSFISSNVSLGAETLGTVPVLGWVTNNSNLACSFTLSQFPGQESYNGNSCGNGEYADGMEGCNQSGGCELFGNKTVAAITSNSEPAPSILDAPAPDAGASALSKWADGTWAGGWVNSLVTNSSYGPASGGKGVAIWDLDNEPAWWDAVHRDVHPSPSTYDEVTNGGIGTALAIKTADPSAKVSGPVIDYWWNYFYSKRDIESGWNTGPCYEPGQNPTDREAHGGVPMIEYYLQQFRKYSQSYGVRLLDYLDVHGYFAPDYPAGSGNSVGFATAGDTDEQQARMNGTRVFWDPTYTDPNFQQPIYPPDSNCSPPLQAPQLIPMLQNWVKKDYPGTGTSIDEYNFGGMESVNGAVVEADILGIFGRQNLSMSALWPTENYSSQGPGNYAFAMYRNYDGKNSTFGDTYLSATSANSGADAENQLAVYAAKRTSDHAITVIVINKTYGTLTSAISLKNFAASSGARAQVYRYSNANLNAIASEPAVAVTPPADGGTTSTLSATFPGQSITLLVIPNP